MKRNSLLDKIRKLRAKYIDIYVDNSFDLSHRIQYLMDLKGYDQKTLAKKLNKNESEISKWLSGSHNFTIKTLAKIEEVLEDKLFHVCNGENSSVNREVVIFWGDYIFNDKSSNIKIEENQNHLMRFSKGKGATHSLNYKC